MAANYLHGAETIEVMVGARPISVVKSAVIGLVGIAPTEYGQNTPVMVLSPSDAAAYGVQVPGFNIPDALEAIFDQGAATVIVVNTFSIASNTSNVALESHTITGGKVSLAFAPIGTISIFESDGTTDAGLTVNEDYTIDAYGNIIFLNGSVSDNTTLKFTYKKLNGASVNDAQIIGAVNEDGTLTGLQVLDLTFGTFGFNPKILITPGYSTEAAVAAELISKANKYRAVTPLDADLGATRDQVIASRASGANAPFNTSDYRAIGCYPMVKAYDPATDTYINKPYSQYLAGLIAAVDNNEGYWISPSNHAISGITGMERYLSAAINDPDSDVNALNENGIVTIFNGFGTGFRAWGNRSLAFPTNTDPEQFICVRRTADVIHESLELAMLQFLDKPINQATIDAIRESVNSFMRTLISRGALIDGNCVFDQTLNPPTELAAGHLTFTISFMPPTPAERITFESFIDISLLQSLT